MSKVIKGELPIEPSMERPALRAPRAGVLNAEEFEARTAAQKIVDEAKRQAQEIVDEANRQKDEIFARARDEARAEVAAQASAEIARAKMQAGQVLASSEGQLIELACRIAEKIIGRDLDRDREVVLEICATAIESVRQAKAMVLRVNPKDGQLLRERKPRLMELVGRTLDIAIKDDADIEPGGCVIQTEFGTVDAQLKTQFDMLKSVLTPEGKKEAK